MSDQTNETQSTQAEPGREVISSNWLSVQFDLLANGNLTVVVTPDDALLQRDDVEPADLVRLGHSITSVGMKVLYQLLFRKTLVQSLDIARYLIDEHRSGPQRQHERLVEGAPEDALLQ